jgi:ubiquinone/menaquinone biosynthesis C-methylase UbiE
VFKEGNLPNNLKADAPTEFVGIDPDDTRRRYDETVDLYERRYAGIQNVKYPVFLDMLEPPSGGRILDWGCGTGLAHPLFHERDITYVGLDFSLPMLLRARARSACSLVLGDCTKLPFCDDSFDGVLGATVLQNIPSRDGAIREVSRILKKGARSVLSYPERAEVTLPKFGDYGLKIITTKTIHEDRAILLQRD